MGPGGIAEWAAFLTGFAAVAAILVGLVRGARAPRDDKGRAEPPIADELRWLSRRIDAMERNLHGTLQEIRRDTAELLRRRD